MTKFVRRFPILLSMILLFGAIAFFSGVAAAQTPAGNSLVAGSAGSVTAPAAAEEAPKGGLLDPDLGTALFTILVFIGLLLILRGAAWKPIIAGLKSREQAIRFSIEAAAKAKAEAERTTRELEAKMAEARQEAAKQLQQAKVDAAKIADSIRATAETESAALKDRTLREIDAAKQQAVAEINTHAAELGTAVARKILQRSVTVDDQQRLVDESLAELAKKN